jgi:hypothetical protein
MAARFIALRSDRRYRSFKQASVSNRNPSIAQQQEHFSAVRAICIGSILLMVGAIWVFVQELLLNAGSLTASSPPVGAVGLFVGLLSIVLLLGWIRARWALGRQELLVIYCMLVTFLPLTSQGLWHRFVGMMVSVRSPGGYPVHVPSHMIPQGDELVRDGQFAQGMEFWQGQAVAHRYQHRDLDRSAVLLENAEEGQTSELRQWLPRRLLPDGPDRFVPGQKYLLAVDLRITGLNDRSWFSGAMSPDGNRWRDLGISKRIAGHLLKGAPPDTVDGTGLIKMRQKAVEIPYTAQDGLWLRLRLAGVGRVEVVKVSFYSNEPIFRLMEGSSEVSAEYKGKVPRDDAARLHYRPQDRASSWLYDARGYVPWGAWAKPLASWSLLWIAMFAAMFALAALLFREWSDRQKLTFPLTQIPLLLTEPDESQRGYLPKMLRSRALHIGVGTALLVYSLNGLHFYNGDYPSIPLNIDLAPFLSRPPWSAMLADGQGFRLRIVLLAVGVAFFMDLQLLFSLWLFYFLCKLYLLLPYYEGTLGTQAWPGGPSYGPIQWQFQAIGAALGIVLVSLWLGRRHFVAVFRRALFADRSVDDSREPMPYRLALIVLVLAMVLACVWGEIAGAGWWFGLGSMGIMLVFAVMAARVRAECAAPNMWLIPATPVILLMAMGGMVSFGVLPMTYFLLMGNFMCAGFFLMMMPAMMESFQIAKVAGIRRRVVGWCMVVGFVVAVVAGGFTLLNWGYARGLASMRGSITERDDFGSVLWRWHAENNPTYNANLRRFQFEARQDAGIELTEDEASDLAALEQLPRIRPVAHIVPISAAITCLLATARLTLLKFPFHPLGYVLANTPLMTYAWGSILIAWLIRLVGLKLGGVRTIRDYLQPYMLGLILGSVLALLAWDAVGMIKIAQGYTGQIFVTW